MLTAAGADDRQWWRGARYDDRDARVAMIRALHHPQAAWAGAVTDGAAEA